MERTMNSSPLLAGATLLLSCAAHGVAPLLDLAFGDPDSFLVPTVGPRISASGPFSVVDGPNFQNTSMRVPKGTSLTASTGRSALDEYTLLLDVRIHTMGTKRSLLQTNSGNSDDADLFIGPTGTIGHERFGYSSSALQTGQWHRIALAYRKGARLEFFLDAQKVHSAVPTPAQGNLSLDSLLLLFADDNQEQDALDVSRILLFPSALDSMEIKAFGTPQDRAFTAHPWLQNVSDTGITILWESNRPTQGSVRFGSGSTLDRTAPSSSLDVSPGLYVHKARLSALSPGTRYRFQATMDSTSIESSFSTAPVVGTGSIRFGVWGDSHDPHPALEMFRYMTDSIGVDFAATSGDVSNSGQDPSDLRANFVANTLYGVGRRVPFFIATGNHDVGSTQSAIHTIRHYFDCPRAINSDSDGITGSYVAFYGPVAMVFIDWQRIETDIPGWLDLQLKSEAVRRARFVFTFIHRAPFYERWQAAGENSFVKGNYPPVLESNGVHASFSGHMHGYERGFRDNTYYITTGGGSYLDANEAVGGDYDFILPGAFEPAPTNYGLIHEIMTVDASDSIATIRMHAFDPVGRYLGIRDSMKILAYRTGVARGHRTPSPALRLLSRGSHLEILFGKDTTAPVGRFRLSSIEGRPIRDAEPDQTRLDLSGLPGGVYVAQWRSPTATITQPVLVPAHRSTR